MPAKREGPKTIADAINGQPGIRISGDATVTVPTLPGKTIPGGDCAFTFFYLGTVAAHEGMLSGLAGWGNGSQVSRASLFEIEGGRLDWATGWGEDAITAVGSFNEHFDKPVILCVRKRPGPINETTDIWINGDAKPLGEKSSSRTPNIVSGSVTMGGAWFGGDMTVGEVILYDRALTDAQTHAVGAYLADKFRISYAGAETPAVPGDVDGLCAWFKLAPQDRPKTAADGAIHNDDFNGYADGTQLREELGPLAWKGVMYGDGRHLLEAVNGVVQRSTSTPWAEGACATRPLHQGEAYARAQVDVRYASHHGSHRAGVFLNAVKWAEGTIGKYGSRNLYRTTIESDGSFLLTGHSDATGKDLSSGRLWPAAPLTSNTWYTLVLEARYGYGKVNLDATVKRTGDGQIMGTYSCIDTQVMLTGGAAGIQRYGSDDAGLRLDNFELQYVD